MNISEFLLSIGTLLSATVFSPANIEDKGVGDAFSALEFNEIISSVELFYRDDNDTPTDSSDDLLGIGKADPAYKVDVAGTIHATGDLRADGELHVTRIYGDGSGLTNLGSSGAFAWIKTGDDLNYPDGKVGVGEASPQALVHAKADEAGSVGVLVENAHESGITQIQLENSHDSDIWHMTHSSNELSFGDGTTKRVVFEPSGEVGIGTVNPDYKLDIASGQLRVSAPDTSLYSGIYTSADDYNFLQLESTHATPVAVGTKFFDNGTVVGQQSYDFSNNALEFYAGGDSAAELVMTVKNNGRVGVGVVNPDQALHVDGNIQWGSGILKTDEGGSLELGDGGSNPYIDFKNDPSSDYDVRLSITGNDTLEISGGTLVVPEPLLPGEVATKNYVDSAQTDFCEVTNSNMTNVNVSGGTPVAFSATAIHNSNTSLFTPLASGVQILEAGTYEISANLYITSNVSRTNVGAEITLDSVVQGVRGAGGYIRNADGHKESSVHVSQILTVAANQVVGVNTQQLAKTGDMALPAAKSNMIIKRLR